MGTSVPLRPVSARKERIGTTDMVVPDMRVAEASGGFSGIFLCVWTSDGAGQCVLTSTSLDNKAMRKVKVM
jgi:hypothetical protein